MIYAGGIWTVGVISALAFGYAWVFHSPRWVYFCLLGLALAVIGGSQFLPQTHPFFVSVRGDLISLMWLGIIAIPVSIYTMFVRWAGRKAKARHESR
ncbi:MAG: hypothetical protein L3J33_06905 [Rhodobacteraceae bacterium]|nr:hypothetical protein [Paracoccaceae bacterium]